MTREIREGLMFTLILLAFIPVPGLGIPASGSLIQPAKRQ